MMRTYFILCFCFCTWLLKAGEPIVDGADTINHWHFSGNNTLNFNQLHLSNWSEGGENSLSGTTYISFSALYANGDYTVEHQVNMGYGMLRSQDKKYKKTEDKLDVTSTFSYKARGKWNYSSLVNFRTQFTNGYKYPNDSTVVSTFMAPAYLTASLGMQFKPSASFSLFISPASGKFTLVLDQNLANAGAFGVTKAVYLNDTSKVITQLGKNIKPEFGFNINAFLKREVLTNVSLESRLILNNNYLDENHMNRWNIDVNWEALLNFTINKYLSSSIRMNMIYDHNIKIAEYEYIDNTKVKVGEGPRTQFKESFGIGLNYRF